MLTVEQFKALEIITKQLQEKHKEYVFEKLRICEDRDGYEIIGFEINGLKVIKYFVTSFSLMEASGATPNAKPEQISYYLTRNKRVKEI